MHHQQLKRQAQRHTNLPHNRLPKRVKLRVGPSRIGGFNAFTRQQVNHIRTRAQLARPLAALFYDALFGIVIEQIAECIRIHLDEHAKHARNHRSI